MIDPVDPGYWGFPQVGPRLPVASEEQSSGDPGLALIPLALAPLKDGPVELAIGALLERLPLGGALDLGWGDRDAYGWTNQANPSAAMAPRADRVRRIRDDIVVAPRSGRGWWLNRRTSS